MKSEVLMGKNIMMTVFQLQLCFKRTCCLCLKSKSCVGKYGS